MERARHLLETSFLSVKEIAHQVGLNDESHFVRDFKKAYGEPPTRYRIRSRGELMNSGNGKTPGDKKGIDEADSGNEPPWSTNKDLAKAVRRSILMFMNLSYWASTFDIGI